MCNIDEIFADLARLYKDESDNEDLRRAVKAKIDARLTSIRNVSSSATATRKVLADATDEVYLAQGQLKEIGAQLNSDQIYKRLLDRFIPDFVQIALNVQAVNFTRLQLTAHCIL